MRENQLSARKTTTTRLTFGERCTKNALSVYLIGDDLNGEKFPIVFPSVWFHLIGQDLNWEKRPIVCLFLWFHLISFFLKNNGFRAIMCKTLKIDIFILYNFCRKYFFTRSIFIDIIWQKNLLKTLFLSFDLKNKICGYFHHDIRNQRLKIHGYSEFHINQR